MNNVYTIATRKPGSRAKEQPVVELKTDNVRARVIFGLCETAPHFRGFLPVSSQSVLKSRYPVLRTKALDDNPDSDLRSFMGVIASAPVLPYTEVANILTERLKRDARRLEEL